MIGNKTTDSRFVLFIQQQVNYKMHMNIRRTTDRKHHKRSKRGSGKVSEIEQRYAIASQVHLMRIQILISQFTVFLYSYFYLSFSYFLFCFLLVHFICRSTGGCKTKSRVIPGIQAKWISETTRAWQEIATLVISKYNSKTFTQS